jgi:hypothetical protein
MLINASGNLEAYIGKPGALGTSETKTGAAVAALDWKFVSIGLKINNDADTADIKFNVNAAESTDTTGTGIYFLDDSSDTKAYIGAKRTASTVWAENYHGFMYDFFVDATYVTGTSAYFFTQGSCTCGGAACATLATECLRDWNFDEFAAGSSCDGTTCANKGCVRSGACQTCTDVYCHLCYDRECTQCSDYF